MSRALLAIGVSKAPPLTELKGAIADAKAVAQWARDNAWESVTAITDEGGAKVEAGAIFDQCQKFLKDATLEQMIIFFAGHGFSPVPGQEIWLLSDWSSDGNEAINASGSIFTAQRFQRPRISFIADACRTTSRIAAGTYGQVILPKPIPASSDSQVDLFYSTAFGDVSQEYQPDAHVPSYGVFSREFLNAVRGAAAESRTPPLRYVVTSRSLQDYLTETVPKACEAIANAVIQHPDATAKWRRPYDVYAEWDAAPSVPQMIIREGAEGSAAGEAAVAKDLARRTSRIDEDASRYLAAEGRQSFESGAGLTIVGAEVHNVLLSAFSSTVFKEAGDWHVRVFSPDGGHVLEKPCTALVHISTARWQDHWIALPVFPGLIATALIDEHGFSSLNYRRIKVAASGEDENRRFLDTALAEATALFRHGLTLPIERVREMIAIMRNHKLENPALAILAAYLSQRSGDLKQIDEMMLYPIGDGPYVPFDLTLLTDHKGYSDADIVGSFPFMSLGWSLLQRDALPDAKLQKLVMCLTPSMWTMVEKVGGEVLSELIAAGR
jgi:hypothetical protein